MVKSVSSSLEAPASEPAQEQELADRLPHAQVEPLGLVFSSDLREQVQAPAARWSVVGKRQSWVLQSKVEWEDEQS